MSKHPRGRSLSRTCVVSRDTTSDNPADKGLMDPDNVRELFPESFHRFKRTRPSSVVRLVEVAPREAGALMETN